MCPWRTGDAYRAKFALSRLHTSSRQFRLSPDRVPGERSCSCCPAHRHAKLNNCGAQFLKNHVADLVSIDFFTISTINFKILFVLVVLSHHRRKVIHFNVTENPTAQWAAQQMVEAFPWDSAPKYLLRDHGAIYGETFSRGVASLGIEQVLSAPRSPWQNPYVERLIGTLRHECFDHVIVLNASHARRILTGHLHYYHRWQTHLSLAMDSPDSRPVHPPEQGAVVEYAEVGGLRRHYERMAA